MAKYDDLTWAMAKTLWEKGESYRTVSEETGIPVNSIRVRKIDEGWTLQAVPRDQTPEARRAKTAAARRAAADKVLERRGELANHLMEDLLELREQLFEPVVVKEAKVVQVGNNMGSEVEIVEIELPRPVPADQQRIVTSMAILTDKLLLLTGEATSRTETVDGSNREAAAARLKMIRDELAERRQPTAPVETAIPAADAG